MTTEESKEADLRVERIARMEFLSAELTMLHLPEETAKRYRKELQELRELIVVKPKPPRHAP